MRHLNYQQGLCNKYRKKTSFWSQLNHNFYFDQLEYELIYAATEACEGQHHSDTSSINHCVINAFIY